MSVIDFPIERINEFLSDHSFVVTKPLGEGVEVDGYLTVKVKLTGIKPMISVGDWKNFIEYTQSILSEDTKVEELCNWENKKQILDWLDSL